MDKPDHKSLHALLGAYLKSKGFMPVVVAPGDLWAHKELGTRTLIQCVNWQIERERLAWQAERDAVNAANPDA